MEYLVNLAIENDDENGLVLAIADSALFDYVEEFLIDTAPEVYAAIEDVEMGPDFGRTLVYFADSLDRADLEKALAGIDQSKLGIY